DLSGVTAGIERRDHAASVRTLPPADVEWNAARCFFDRTRTTDKRRRVPREFLRRESLDARVGQDARQRSGKTETVGQHVLRAGLAELALEKFIAVKNLAKDRLRRR